LQQATQTGIEITCLVSEEIDAAWALHVRTREGGCQSKVAEVQIRLYPKVIGLDIKYDL
jgi:hypothetical protein